MTDEGDGSGGSADDAGTDGESEPDGSGRRPFSRRGLLGGAAAFGVGVGSAVGFDVWGGDGEPFGRDDDPRTATPTDGLGATVANHDHSGEYGARARLGDASPVESITVAREHVARYPVVDVRAFGAAGDGETDDADAIQAAADSIEDVGVLYFGPGRYAVGDTIRCGTDAVRAVVGENAFVEVDGDYPAFRVTGSATEGSAPPPVRGQGLYRTELLPVVTGIQVHSTAGAFQGTGIEAANVFGLLVTRCGLHNLDTGIRIRDRNRNIAITNNHIWDNRHYGIHWDGCDLHQTLVADNFVGYSHVPLYAERAELYNVHVTNNDIEGGIGERKPLENLLRFEAGPSSGTLAEAKIQGNTIQEHYSANGALVRLKNPQRDDRVAFPSNFRFVDVSDNVISNGAGPGLAFENVTGLKVSDNLFMRFRDAMVRGDGKLEDVKISGNQLSDFYLDTGYAPGIQLRSAHLRGLQVTDNELHQLTDKPLEVTDRGDGGKAVGWKSVQIAGNLFRMKYPREFDKEWLDRLSLSGPLVDVDNESGAVTGVTITGNQIQSREFVDGGVRVRGADASAVMVTNNLIHGPLAGTGFDLPDGEDVVAANNLVGS